MEAKRLRQLEEARRERTELEDRLAVLRGRGPTAQEPPAPAAASPNESGEIAAFCLRERRMVAMVLPEPVQLKNGRRALAGTCPSCGGRVIRMARAGEA